MQAFHNKPELKTYFVENAIWHQEQDKFVQGLGEYDKNQKGCMIACSFKKYDHKEGEKESGVPEWLLRLADTIFEGLTKEDSDLWAQRFWRAIPVGADLDKVKGPFLIYVLEGVLKTFDNEKYPQGKAAIEKVIRLYKSGEKDPDKFMEAKIAADAAGYAAADAADAAGYAAAAAAAADDAAAAAAAADDAAAYAYADADAAVKTKIYKGFADKLLELMSGDDET